jgi:type IV secretory pathway TraG/TraD family ATPase VirD4
LAAAENESKRVDALRIIAALVAVSLLIQGLLCLFRTEAVQRWLARTVRWHRFFSWPVPPELNEWYLLSRYYYFQLKFVGVLALVGSAIACLVALAGKR